MGVLEIVLLLAGAILAVLSFVLPAAEEKVPQETRKLAEGEIKTLVEQEMDGVRHHVDSVVDEAIEYAVEKTERSLERLTNEKIMAVNEYSDTVLKEIHKNHEEAMFLYDMLNNKHTNLKNMVSEVDRSVQEVRETKREAEAVVNSFQQLKPATVSASWDDSRTQDFREEKKTGVQRIREMQMAARAKDDNTATKEKKAVSGENTSVKNSSPKKEESGSEHKVTTVMDLNFMTEGQDARTNKNEQILQLYRQGKSTVAIAKELGLGVGEVKLVIDLHKSL